MTGASAIGKVNAAAFFTTNQRRMEMKTKVTRQDIDEIGGYLNRLAALIQQVGHNCDLLKEVLEVHNAFLLEFPKFKEAWENHKANYHCPACEGQKERSH